MEIIGGLSVGGPVQRQVDMQNRFESLFGGLSSAASKNAFRSFLDTFLSSIDGRMSQLSQACESVDRKNIRLLSHQLRSSFRTLGADEFADLCRDIEEHCVRVEGTLDREWMLRLQRQIQIQIPDLLEDVRKFVRKL